MDIVSTMLDDISCTLLLTSQLVHLKTIQSTFYRNGNLYEDDQILAINGQRIDTGLSQQEAIAILQKAQGHVELIVARGKAHKPPGISRQDSNASSSFVTRTNSRASSVSSAPVRSFIFNIHILACHE